jgi:putative MFS transporter
MLLGISLPQLQAGLEMSDAEGAAVLGVVALGVIPALIVGSTADRWGRRRLMLFAFGGLGLANLATAFSMDASQLALTQIAANAFRILIEVTLAVLAIEQASAERRGYVAGLFRTIGMTVGGVVALATYSQIDLLPYGWRGLFAMGALPILLIPWVASRLGEGQRFEAHRAERERDAAPPISLWVRLRELFRERGRALGSLLAVVLITSVLFGPSGNLVSKVLQDSHGFNPGEVSLFYVATGVLVPAAGLIAASLSDHIGRRGVLVVSTLIGAVGVAAFFNATGIVLLSIGLALLSVAGVIVSMTCTAVAPELFPTAYRSMATSFRELAGAVGTAVGMGAIALLEASAGGLAGAMTLLLWLTPLVPLVIWLGLPETSQRELEEI